MIIDFRTYTYQPSNFYRFLQMYKDTGFELTNRWLGTTVGIFTSHSGRANRTLQLFAYRDFDHRDECRAGLRQDQDWQRYIKEAAPFIREQENAILEHQGDNWPWLVAGTSAQPGKGGLFELRRERALTPQASDLFQAWSKLNLDDVSVRSGQRIVMRPLTGSLDTVYIMERFASDAERHGSLKNGREPSLASANLNETLSIRSIDSELWLPTDYSPSR